MMAYRADMQPLTITVQTKRDDGREKLQRAKGQHKVNHVGDLRRAVVDAELMRAVRKLFDRVTSDVQSRVVTWCESISGNPSMGTCHLQVSGG